MTEIKLLDKDTINKIAAGEVIERPFSVVKELVENSIDAGSDNVVIEVKEGGKNQIKVADNGKGMAREDLKLCFIRHATSKLKDLFNIDTLGFRGEALSSIAAISNMNVNANDGTGGISLLLSEGYIVSEKEIGMNKGTIVEVNDLFFNTPVRKNYLKGKDVELSHIIDIVTRYSLANKNISFKLISDNKSVLVSPKTNDLLNKIVGIYGKEIGKNMTPISYTDDFVKINGYIGKPYLAKMDRNMQSVFVNGRYVKSETVSKAIYDAYHTLLFLDRHPVIVMNIEIDFTDVDVNVHPTKNIIRIEKEESLYKSVFSAFKHAFETNDMIPEVNTDNETAIESKQNYKMEAGEQTLLVKETEKKPEPLSTENPIDYQKAFEIESKLGPMVILGQLNKMYILAENAKGLLIIDQHALQERILFEKFWKQFEEKKIEEQVLLRPIVIELSIIEKQILLNNIDVMKNLGFEIEEYFDNSVIVRQVPKIFGIFDKERILELISDLKNTERYMDDIKEEKIAKMACRKAVKAGDTLTMPEMERLIKDLDSCEKPFSCPHGRPTMINLSLGDLEKKFKRMD